MQLIDDQSIKDALVELDEKSLIDIEQETSIKWGARAIAAKRLGMDEAYIVFQNEALEHAAMVSGDLVDQINAEIESDREE